MTKSKTLKGHGKKEAGSSGQKQQHHKTPEKESKHTMHGKVKPCSTTSAAASSSISSSSLDSSPSTVLEVTSSSFGAHHGKQHHHSPHASRVGSMNISNMHKNVVPYTSRIMDGKSKTVSARSRVRNDPRADSRPNDNLPVEASAESLTEGTQSMVNLMDECLEPKSLFNSDVRFEFQADVMRCLSGSPCSPEKFFVKLPEGAKADMSYLDRHVDPHKLIDFMVHHMNAYYDLTKDSDPLSESHQQLDNMLWDNLAFIIPMLCRQAVSLFRTEPMILTDVEPNALIFGDLHGNFNDLYYIHKNFISNPKYEHYTFIFLGDYVDRGPKPVEILCFLFALKLAKPKRFVLLRGNHEVLKVNRKYGFQAVCSHIFLDTYISKPTLAELNYKSFNRAFCYLPVGAVIKCEQDNRQIFCCHGGVPSQLLKPEGTRESGWTVHQLNKLLVKPASLAPSKKAPWQVLALNEILWNDPIPARLREKRKYRKRNFYRNKKRGGHCSFFTEGGLVAFLKANHLQMVVRGHQYRHCQNTGTKAEFDGRLLTVFSSSNYCGSERNTTGYVEVTGADCQVRAHVLRPYDESRKYRDFNVLKVITDKTTKQVTHVAF